MKKNAASASTMTKARNGMAPTNRATKPMLAEIMPKAPVKVLNSNVDAFADVLSNRYMTFTTELERPMTTMPESA